MSKKWKITLGVLAVLVIFCLWYTRPRSFEELVLSGKIDNMAFGSGHRLFQRPDRHEIVGY